MKPKFTAFMKRAAAQVSLDKVSAALRETSAEDLVQGAVRFACAYPTLIFAVVLVTLLQYNAPAVEKLPEGALGVYNAAELVGIAWLVVGVMWEVLSVTVMEELGFEDEFRGLVRHSGEITPEVLTEGFMHWAMLMNLAGSEAEFAILGERANGAERDNRHWLATATSYLSAGFGEVFYADPAGNAQQAHNRAVLNELKAQHVAELGRRFAVNKIVLSELAGIIAEKKAMARDEIAPYLARVVKPE